MIIAPDFADDEYFEPKKLFEEEGFSITTASTRTQEIRGSGGGIAVSDLVIQMVDPREYDAVLLIGGKGAPVFFEDKKTHDLLRGFCDEGKLVAALSNSPVTLANAGLLKGKKATVSEDEKLVNNLKANEADYTSLAITIDSNVITAQGLHSARECSQEMVTILKNGEE